MAKLSDRQKNNLIAKYKTGTYTNIQLAKTYKISESMVRKICDNTTKENAFIVEAQVALENAKKCEKSAIDNNAINQAVKYKLNSLEYKEKNIRSVHEVANDILTNLQKSINNGKAQKIVTEGKGMGVSMARVVECDYQPEHYEKASNSLYKTAQTLGAIEEKANVQIANQNNQDNTKVEIVGYGVQTIES